MKVKGTRLWCILQECVKYNYAARFHTLSYQACREMHFKSRLDVKFWQSQWSVKCRSRAPGYCVWLKSVSMTITKQGFILTAITDAEKCPLILNSTQILTKPVKCEM